MRRALAEADYRRLVRWEDIRAGLGRGHPGSANLRRAVAIHHPRSRGLQRARAELPRPVRRASRHSRARVNVVVAGFRVDALWPDERLIVELDGTGNHTNAQLHRDHERDFRLRALGYLILR